MDIARTDIKILKTFRILVSGRVQGVGFRYFAHERALQCNIKGYVQNTHDNRVEIICQGQKNDLDMFIMAVRKGPALSFISEFLLEEIVKCSIYDIFEIKH
jgi:acylphosphatase